MGTLKPSSYLGIDVSDVQMSVIQPSEEELTQGRIMKETVGTGAKLKLVKRKLDNLEYIKSESGIQNNEKHLKRLENQMEMTASLVEINASKDEEREEKVETQKEKYRQTAHSSFEKLKKSNNDIQKTKKKEEIASIVFVGYQVFMDSRKNTAINKTALVTKLDDKEESCPIVLITEISSTSTKYGFVSSCRNYFKGAN